MRQRPPSSNEILAICLAIALPVLASSAVAQERDAGPEHAANATERWLEHARACLVGKFSLQADFTHEVLHPLGGTQPTAAGVVQLRRGGRLRLEYRTPDRRLVVADGKKIKAYDPQTKTLYESPARGGLLALAFGLALDGTRPGRFEARWIGGGTAPGGTAPAVIELVPGAANPLAAKVLLTLDPGCPAVRRITVIDQAGVAVRVTLTNQRFNDGIGARRFQLTPPPGTTIVTP